jgi:hypothetical protein
MFGPEPGNLANHWYRFDFDAASNTGAVIVGNEVTLHFVDGARGDTDSTANGVITDPGGPATAIPNANGGGSGGCALNSDDASLRDSGAWLLMCGLLIFRFVSRVARKHGKWWADPSEVKGSKPALRLYIYPVPFRQLQEVAFQDPAESGGIHQR